MDLMKRIRITGIIVQTFLLAVQARRLRKRNGVYI